MGFLDRVKKVAQQAKDFAEDQIEQRQQQQASSDAAPVSAGGGGSDGGGGGGDGGGGGPVVFGTPAGELGEKWKAVGLSDPAGVVPPKARDVAGVPKSTKSAVVSESYGIGRRWTAGNKSIGVFWLIDPANPPAEPTGTGARFDALRTGEAKDVPDIGEGAYVLDLGSGRHGVFVKNNGIAVVVEVAGIPREAAMQLAQAATMNMDY